jgi:hypothetical protein
MTERRGCGGWRDRNGRLREEQLTVVGRHRGRIGQCAGAVDGGEQTAGGGILHESRARVCEDDEPSGRGAGTAAEPPLADVQRGAAGVDVHVEVDDLEAGGDDTGDAPDVVHPSGGEAFPVDGGPCPRVAPGRDEEQRAAGQGRHGGGRDGIVGAGDRPPVDEGVRTDALGPPQHGVHRRLIEIVEEQGATIRGDERLHRVTRVPPDDDRPRVGECSIARDGRAPDEWDRGGSHQRGGGKRRHRARSGGQKPKGRAHALGHRAPR